MRNILVPTDFSDYADLALQYAVNLAKNADAHIYLVHAYSRLENPLINSQDLRDDFNDYQFNIKEKALNEKIREIKEQGVKASSHILHGKVEEGIIQFAKRKKMELIVLGTQGATGLAEVIVGSTAASIIAQSEVPVLAIPRHSEIKDAREIVMARESFEVEPEFVEPVLDIAEIFGAKVSVVHIKSASGKAVPESEIEKYRDRLRAHKPKLQIESRVIEGDDFEDTMQRYSEEVKAGMIAMASYKRGFFERIFKPSRTRSMAFHSSMPLLAIPLQARK